MNLIGHKLDTLQFVESSGFWIAALWVQIEEGDVFHNMKIDVRFPGNKNQTFADLEALAVEKSLALMRLVIGS